MMNKTLILMGVFFVSLCASLHGVEVSIEADGMLNVDGERLFVLGFYDMPTADGELDRLAAAGVNLVHSKADSASLDLLHERGLYGWLGTTNSIDLSEDVASREEALRGMTAEFNDHPALLVWEVPDEALWNTWYGAEIWRRHKEPGEQKEAISTISDVALRDKLSEEREAIDRLQMIGKNKEAEAMADDLWRTLGVDPPHPGYGLGNAEERATVQCAGMVKGYHFLKGLSGRPIWMNHAPRNQIEQLAAYNHGADIVGCDIYPVPENSSIDHSDLANKKLSCVGDFTRRMGNAAPGKPVWMVLQGFGWGDIQRQRSEEERKVLRRPSKSESRFMAYDAIVHGARGILYWGSAYVEKDSSFYEELLQVVGELRDIQEVLASPDANFDIQTRFEQVQGSVDRDIVVLAKKAAGTPWLLVVNEWTGPLVTTLSGLDALNGMKYRERYSGEILEIEQGAVRLHMSSRSVKVLEPLD
ncbi:MAG: hypothetical protein GX117_08110 [Candidatus Hydrogenedentes bacterium]|nr:hypothetical protein [Candidatus Hydrogenedentota bacterium]